MPECRTNAVTDEERSLVERIALSLKRDLPPTVDLRDLIQAGMIGLLEARQRYRPGRGAQFNTFASTRIRGAMVDEIRRYDWAPRRLRRWDRQYEAMQAKLQAQHGRPVSRHETLKALGWFGEGDPRSASSRLGVLMEPYEDEYGNDTLSRVDNGDSPEEQVEQLNLLAHVHACRARLRARHRRLLKWRYVDDLSLSEIARRLNVGESRASQLHTKALAKLRSLARPGAHPRARPQPNSVPLE